MRPQRVTPPLDRAISRLAAAQYGVVARHQLLALGLDGSAIKRRVRAGRLHAIHREVYAVGHTILKAEGRWLAAVMACGDGAVLSHATAAALWDLRPTASGHVHVTVPVAGGRRAIASVTIHRTRRPIEATVHHGIPVTTPARTLADLADSAPTRVVEKALEQAEILRVLDVRAIEAVAAANPGRAGPARLLGLVRRHEPTGALTRSELEDAFVALCRRHRLPEPRVNARVQGLEVDFSWPAHRLIAEVDGFRYHGTRAAFERDRARDARLTSKGWRVVRFTDGQVRRDAATVTDQLGTLLAGLHGAAGRGGARQ